MHFQFTVIAVYQVPLLPASTMSASRTTGCSLPLGTRQPSAPSGLCKRFLHSRFAAPPLGFLRSLRASATRTFCKSGLQSFCRMLPAFCSSRLLPEFMSAFCTSGLQLLLLGTQLSNAGGLEACFPKLRFTALDVRNLQSSAAFSFYERSQHFGSTALTVWHSAGFGGFKLRWVLFAFQVYNSFRLVFCIFRLPPAL